MNDINPKDDFQKEYKCKSCKDLPSTYYTDNGLQPIWYEHVPNATSWEDFAFDKDGK